VTAAGVGTAVRAGREARSSISRASGLWVARVGGDAAAMRPVLRLAAGFGARCSTGGDVVEVSAW